MEEAGVDNEYEVIGDPDVVTTTASAGGSAAGYSAGTVKLEVQQLPFLD